MSNIGYNSYQDSHFCPPDPMQPSGYDESIYETAVQLVNDYWAECAANAAKEVPNVRDWDEELYFIVEDCLTKAEEDGYWTRADQRVMDEWEWQVHPTEAQITQYKALAEYYETLWDKGIEFV